MVDFDEVVLDPPLEPFSANSDYAPAIVENPSEDDTNPSEFVFGGASVAGTWEGVWFDLLEPIDFSTTKTFKMLVYSEAGGQPMMKIEDPVGGTPFIEIPEDYTEIGEWQELTFTFEDADDDNTPFTRLAIFLDFGGEEIGNLWYFDNLIGPEGYEPVSVNNLGAIQNSIYPNPFNHQMQIKLVLPISELNLFNVTGQNVISVAPNSVNVTLETSQLKTGIYFMNVKDVNGVVSTSKLVKK